MKIQASDRAVAVSDVTVDILCVWAGLLCFGEILDEKAFAVVPSVDLDSFGLLKSRPVSGWMEGMGCRVLVDLAVWRGLISEEACSEQAA